jgi:hypothetical protein
MGSCVIAQFDRPRPHNLLASENLPRPVCSPHGDRRGSANKSAQALVRARQSVSSLTLAQHDSEPRPRDRQKHRPVGETGAKEDLREIACLNTLFLVTQPSFGPARAARLTFEVPLTLLKFHQPFVETQASMYTFVAVPGYTQSSSEKATTELAPVVTHNSFLETNRRVSERADLDVHHYKPQD